MADDVLSNSAVGRSAIHKATWHLIPLIALGYGIAYIDRVNISFASLQMNHDLHFSEVIYGTGAGVFFLSYAACEIPSNMLLYRFGARRWLARIMISWGVIAMGMLFVRTPNEFYLARFLLGIAEAGFFPGVIFYLMQWFPPELRARTISRFYISYPLSSVVSGAVAGALLNLNGRWGLSGWQWLFLVEGFPAVILSFFFLRFLPDGPRDASWLTVQEQDWILARIQRDADEGGHSHDILAALRDPRVIQIGLFSMCMQMVAYGYAFSQPAILKKLTGWDATHVGYLVSGMALLGALAMLWNAAHSDRKGERYWHVVVPFLLIFVGYLVGGVVGVAVGAVPALTLVVIGNAALQPAYLVMAPQFLKGKSAAAGIAAINMIGIVGGFLGPFWMGLVKDRTHSDQTALLTLTVPSLLAIGIVLNMRRVAGRSA